MIDTVFDRRAFIAGAGAVIAATAAGAANGKARPVSTMAIDHISLGVKNLFEGAARLQIETGIVGTEGSWFPEVGMANRYFRTGNSTYIEVESVIDPYAVESLRPAKHFVEQLRDGDRFLGWVIRVETREELQEIASRLRSEILDSPLGQNVSGGPRANYVRTPETFSCWSRGLPNFIYWDQKPKPITPGPVIPTGIAWLEVGGTEQRMRDWIGNDITRLPLRFNGKELGVHAVAIQVEGRVIEVRRPPITPL